MQLCSSSSTKAVPVLSLKNICEQNGNIRQSAIVNANCQKVITTLDNRLSDERFMGACRCAKCLDDMAAFALNCLPPHYYVDAGRGGEIGSPAVMVESAVIEAINTVAMNPRHQKS
jgi:hypothetical protein